MGTEILGVFIFAPLLFWLFDISRIIKGKSVIKHILLLVIGFLYLAYMALSSYFGGWNPFQGLVVGSVFYAPGYLIMYIILILIFDRLEPK